MVSVKFYDDYLETTDVASNTIINTITYASIDTIYPTTSVQQYRSASVLMSPPDTTTYEKKWHVNILLRDGRQERIELSNVTNQAGWANDATGAGACVNDIYAAFT